MNDWTLRRKAVAICVALAVFCAAAGLAFETLLAAVRPPQPLPLGTVQWLGEAVATVDSVDRAAQIGAGANAVRAPFGMRPTWHDSDVRVDTYGHSGATLPAMHFEVDARAQAVMDRITHRPGPVHEVRGAQQHEDLVFDLPRDVEQPGLVFLPANDPSGMLDVLFGRFWQPHRFNLRYD